MSEETVSPVRPYRIVVHDSGDPGYVNRIMIGTASTGWKRDEWISARYGQIVPVNWSMVQMNSFLDSFNPLRYQVADAQNLIVKEFIEKDFEWCYFLEHDDILPVDGFLRLNKYMEEAKYPVVSALYYTKSRPSEPLIFRGRGVGVYKDWKPGDLVWCDGVPTGALLVHRALLKAMWDESPEYLIRGRELTRRVFDSPRYQWFDPETNQVNSVTGTSDLDWCTRVMKGDYFRKSGWTEFADKEFPFVVDTGFFCRHIDNSTGEQFP